jgi:hypothetical protein
MNMEKICSSEKSVFSVKTHNKTIQKITTMKASELKQVP